MLHVIFSDSAAGTLRQVLRSRGITDRVVSLAENLDWGWISSERVEDRLRWFDENADLDWDWVADCASKFLAEVVSGGDQLIWMAPRSAREQCGLFWLMHETKLPPSQMIVADYVLGTWRDEPPLGLGELGPDHMARLLDASPRLEWESSRFPLEKWRSLMDDGAILRIIEGGVVQSASADHFDAVILDRCPREWTKWHRVIGYAMVDASDAGHSVNDMFLRWRLEQLIESGAIEANAELPDWDAPTTKKPTLVRRI